MASERVQVEFTPETRRLVIRLIEAVEKLGGGREGEVNVSTVARALAPAVAQIDALLEESNRDGVAYRLIGQALGVTIPKVGESPTFHSSNDPYVDMPNVAAKP